MAYTDREKKDLEEAKITVDYFKHLTTLSTGSVLLIATFIEKIFTNPSWKPLVAVSVGAFLVSLISAVGVMSAFVWDPHDHSDSSSVSRTLLIVLGTVGAWAGFLVGMLVFAAFAMRNLY